MKSELGSKEESDKFLKRELNLLLQYQKHAEIYAKQFLQSDQFLKNKSKSINNIYLKIKNMIRTAKAHWSGNLKEGKGTLTTQSGILDNTNYSFKTRFEEGQKGTNPEELLAAAHAGCFTMAVASILTQKGFNPGYLDTEATVSMEDLTITGVHLTIKGSVPGINAEDFIRITKDAEKNCIISKALKIVITSEAHFIV